MPKYSRFRTLCRLLSLTVLIGSCIAPTVARAQATAETEQQADSAGSQLPSSQLPSSQLPSSQSPGSQPAATAAESSGAAENAASAEPLSADEAEYLASEEALREHLKTMRLVQLDFHLSETPARDLEYRKQWADSCDVGRPIFARARAAMIKKYLSAPTANAQLGDLLFELLERNVTDSRFEGMLELALALETGGVKDVKLPAFIALCALAENEFALAKTRCETMPMESRPKLPVLGAFVPFLDDLQKNWDEEQEFRKQDAEGEPLPRVKISTTKGSCVVELFEDQAPETVANFIHLVEQGFYSGLTFHRVLEHFVAQTGCPEGDGSGGPGYTIYGEASKPNARKFFRGTLGLALSNGDENSGGSQFFISFVPTHNLNGKYTAFGRIVSGIEMIGNLAKVNPDDEKKKEDAPQLLDEVIEITVLQKRNHPYEPNKVKR